ncbi:MAG: hypothetical protein B6I18_08880 [Bacteroidetes bacterium 4572_112]|nr:MAG: hypothetical protein B6I18_08880 [Bacteroidetes bacterium 4572_112]
MKNKVIYKDADVWYLNRKTKAKENDTGIKSIKQSDIDYDNYIAIYKAIGGTYDWSGRLIISKEETLEILNKNTTEIYYNYINDELIGYFEFDFSDNAEIIYFGLMPNSISKGLGKKMMDNALDILKSKNIDTIMLHTCSLDHENALRFYKKCGFEVFYEKIEAQAIIT